MNQWEQKGKNPILFHLSLPLLLSLYLSASVFPRRNNWHSSPSRGKKLICILPHKHTLTLGLSTQTPKKAEESSPSSSFPEKPPSSPAAALSSRPSTLTAVEKKKKTFLPITPRPPKVHSGINPSRPWLLEVSDCSSWTSFVLHAFCCRNSQMSSLKGGVLPLKEAFFQHGAKCPLFLDSYYFYTVKNPKTTSNGLPSRQIQSLLWKTNI